MMRKIEELEDWRWSGELVWTVMILRTPQGVAGNGDIHIELPTQICKEYSRELFFTIIVCCFAGTQVGVGFYVLDKPIRVVLASVMLIPCKSNQCIDQLN